MTNNNTHVKVVKINDIITTTNNSKNQGTKYNKSKRKNKYEEMLASTEKIKELLRRKYNSKKVEEKNIKNNFIKNPQQPKEIITNIQPTIQKKNVKQTYNRTHKKSRIKIKTFTKDTINNILKELNETKINNKHLNKEDLLKIFRNILNTNDISLTNKFIKKISRKQTILLLSFLSIIKIKTKAPAPLLKNLLYNYLTSDITIIIT